MVYSFHSFVSVTLSKPPLAESKNFLSRPSTPNLNETASPPAAPRFPWLLTGAAAVAGAAAFWAVNKYVVPMVWGDKPSSRSRKAADDDVDDLDLGLDDDDDEG